MHYIVGLGNPGEEYELTRHNAGRMAVLELAKKEGIGELVFDKKINALVGKGKIGGDPAFAKASAGKGKVQIILPETFMNKSGNALKNIITSVKKAESLIVVHDDIDLPLGKIKISFGKNSGGHKGVESVIKAVKTINFTRVRIGISATNAKGVVKKPAGDKFLDYIVAKFKPAELVEIKKSVKKSVEALNLIVSEGAERAMSESN